MIVEGKPLKKEMWVWFVCSDDGADIFVGLEET